MRRIVPLALILILVACDGGGEPTTTTAPSGSSTVVATTPTTDPGEGCRRLAEDAYVLLAALVEELDGITAEQLSDRAQWPPALDELEGQGQELDRRAAELGCDPGTVQQEVLVRASNLQAQGLGRLLIDLLLGRAG